MAKVFGDVDGFFWKSLKIFSIRFIIVVFVASNIFIKCCCR